MIMVRHIDNVAEYATDWTYMYVHDAKISTTVLKTSYWYMVGFKCNDVLTC